MVNRIQNRNPGYSDNIFKNPNIDKNTLNSIDGATALKLDEEVEINTNPNDMAHSSSIQDTADTVETIRDTAAQGISIENASYIENNLEVGNQINHTGIEEEEYTPKLFSEDESNKVDEEDAHNDKLFDQNSSEDEDFEIPAFLRKQKH